MLLVGWQEGYLGAGMVVCLERGADLHMAQLMPLSLASVKSSFTFLVPAHPGSPGRAIKPQSVKPTFGSCSVKAVYNYLRCISFMIPRSCSHVQDATGRHVSVV